ncbi:cupredoxin domain-containing protein [Natronobiforma cellulositropha]|uniref:cupredoxin domain-containing protein n=1 Tax=Natronobiforma cellulositropha TaxID=1679076 RepID=UPI0021D5AC2C|nr:plastocyanin [Natronobiforma cellulositropha]
MSERQIQTDGESTVPTARVDRRRLLQVVGAGAVVTAFGTGTVLAGGDESKHGKGNDENGMDGGDEHDSPLEADGADDRSGRDVHPVFGFSALSPEVEPPDEPEHEIQANTVPREGEEVPEFFFEPTGLFVEPGETVQVTLSTPHHSVTAYHPAQGVQQRVPDGVPPFSSPVLPAGAYWLYTFETPGVYDVHCGPHELFGHVARLVVGEATGPGAEPPVPEATPDEHGHDDEHTDEHEHTDETEDERADDAGETDDPPEPRPPVGAALTVLADPALDPERIVGQGRVSWDEIDEANKALPF